MNSKKLNLGGPRGQRGNSSRLPALCALGVFLLAGLASANITERRENQYLVARTKVRIDEGWKVLVGSNPSGAQNTNFDDAS